jgi:DNA-binding NtrC family response regulator
MNQLPPVLVVDDEKNMRASLDSMLRDEGYEVCTAESAEEGLRRLEHGRFLMVITDARLGGMTGYELLGQIKTRWPDMPALMITAYATTKLAVEAIRAGAMDYLAKPFAPEELLHAVQRCAERHQLLAENVSLRAHVNGTISLDRIVGESAPMLEVKRLVQTVGPTDARALILGESGTGKELIAGAMHYLSRRSSAPYVRINCAAIPEALLESELFGHEKGAFTGALKQKPGRFEEADGGTVFLDEIADMSSPLQAKLLRFLEDGTFCRVGGTHELRVNVRLVAATNRDLIRAIQGHTFREDLYHRLNVVQFRMPPLRERGQDILLLADHFRVTFAAGMAKTITGFSPGAQQRLLAHTWPGNVRELRNVVERAMILESSSVVSESNLPDFHLESSLRKGEAVTSHTNKPLDVALADFERELIKAVFEQCQHNWNRTAERLGISRHALRYRMQRLGQNPDDEGDLRD